MWENKKVFIIGNVNVTAEKKLLLARQIYKMDIQRVVDVFKQKVELKLKINRRYVN